MSACPLQPRQTWDRDPVIRMLPGERPVPRTEAEVDRRITDAQLPPRPWTRIIVVLP